MNFEPIQKEVDEWINSTGVRYFDPMTNMAILTEEVGEIARIMARTHGEQSTKKGSQLGDLGDELTDAIWVITCLANQNGIDLTKAWKKNMDKKMSRDKDRHRENPKLT